MRYLPWVLFAVALSAAEIPLTKSAIEVLDARGAEPVQYKGKSALKVTDGGIVLLKGITFQNGTIEAEVAGTPIAGASEGARGFIGIAFRVHDKSTYEC